MTTCGGRKRGTCGGEHGVRSCLVQLHSAPPEFTNLLSEQGGSGGHEGSSPHQARKTARTGLWTVWTAVPRLHRSRHGVRSEWDAPHAMERGEARKMETGGLVQVAWSVRGGASVVPAGARDDLWGGANADDVANILFTHDERSCARGGRLLDGPPRCDSGQPFTDVGEASAFRHDRSYCNDRTPLICKDGNRM